MVCSVQFEVHTEAEHYSIVTGKLTGCSDVCATVNTAIHVQSEFSFFFVLENGQKL